MNWLQIKDANGEDVFVNFNEVKQVMKVRQRVASQIEDPKGGKINRVVPSLDSQLNLIMSQTPIGMAQNGVPIVITTSITVHRDSEEKVLSFLMELCK